MYVYIYILCIYIYIMYIYIMYIYILCIYIYYVYIYILCIYLYICIYYISLWTIIFPSIFIPCLEPKFEDFKPKHAIALSNFTILGGAIANTLANVRSNAPPWSCVWKFRHFQWRLDPKRIHGIGRFTIKNQPNAGKYTSPIRPRWYT